MRNAYLLLFFLLARRPAPAGANRPPARGHHPRLGQYVLWEPGAGRGGAVRLPLLLRRAANWQPARDGAGCGPAAARGATGCPARHGPAVRHRRGPQRFHYQGSRPGHAAAGPALQSARVGGYDRGGRGRGPLRAGLLRRAGAPPLRSRARRESGRNQHHIGLCVLRGHD